MTTKAIVTPMNESSQDDPVLRNSRREAGAILLIWILATIACCGISGMLGFQPTSGDSAPAPIPMLWGMPRWFALGVMIPWVFCFLAIWWIAGLFMAEDDLGVDHSGELDSDIREEAHNG